MTSGSPALTELGVTECVLRGEPTTEAEFNPLFAKVTAADANVTAIDSSDPADWGTTWAAVVVKRDALIAAEPHSQVRAQRDRLIAATDWWASSALTRTAEQTAYRQALRDITDTYTSLDDVVWPTKP